MGFGLCPWEHSNIYISMKGTLNGMPPILLCWPTTSEADAGGTALEVGLYHQQFISFVAVRQIAAEGQSDKMV
jgi:hypothetical protein